MKRKFDSQPLNNKTSAAPKKLFDNESVDMNNQQKVSSTDKIISCAGKKQFVI